MVATFSLPRPGDAINIDATNGIRDCSRGIHPSVAPAAL
eukprot:CAMPEP_0172526760 /NCGR_PEP_ID=MMETSP1067-20121228/1600_1 /TAXON_ID=265564 ORGANISM="Thalassiosira punctigera, Strain Tpunct2005C2" /NCGR_SAMPLE_ID=MMETSP1067 /ASSEMBLY_ACC=CAM_ASM_000444 /LENGTH=38 /DNA_ID= /DNA_START= /DNA_END= /DNA_ORIENTATION=